MFKKEEPKKEVLNHPDFEKNKSDTKKLFEFWEKKFESHPSRPILTIGENILYLAWDELIHGGKYRYCSPTPFNQSWIDFRGAVTAAFRKAHILGKRDDMKASGELRKVKGIRVTEKGNSHKEMFNFYSD